LALFVRRNFFDIVEEYLPAVLPARSTFASSSSAGSMSGFQPTFNSAPVQSFPNQQTFLPPDHSLHQGADPNSPELFRQNIRIVQEHVVRLQELARRASAGMSVLSDAFLVINVIDRHGNYTPTANTHIILETALLTPNVSPTFNLWPYILTPQSSKHRLDQADAPSHRRYHAPLRRWRASFTAHTCSLRCSFRASVRTAADG
jgi:hypothetical protein